MGINIASSFTRNAPVPIDDLSVVADLTARDAIPAGVRYEGMPVYVVSEGVNYQLIGGILNANWEEFGSGGGGGGSSLQLYPIDTEASPNVSFRSAFKSWEFTVNESVSLWGVLTVPSSYKPGSKIVLEKGKCFTNSTDTTKDIRFLAATRLFKNGTNLFIGNEDAVGLSTNVEIAPNGSVPYAQLDIGDMDLTSAIGKINSVAVAPGDTLLIQIYRSLYTETASDPLPAYLLDNSLIPNFAAE